MVYIEMVLDRLLQASYFTTSNFSLHVVEKNGDQQWDDSTHDTCMMTKPTPSSTVTPGLDYIRKVNQRWALVTHSEI